MAEGARLESVYTATYRGFESLPHRQIKKTDLRVGFLLSWFPGNRTEVINDGSDPIPQNVIVMNNILFVVSQP